METLKDVARKIDEWTRSLARQLVPQPAPVPVRVKAAGKPGTDRRR